MMHELRDHYGSTLDVFDNEFDARAEAVQLFGPDADINDMDSDGRSLIWRNTEESIDDDGARAVGVILRISG